jgi:hypothetical protein
VAELVKSSVESISIARLNTSFFFWNSMALFCLRSGRVRHVNFPVLHASGIASSEVPQSDLHKLKNISGDLLHHVKFIILHFIRESKSQKLQCISKTITSPMQRFMCVSREVEVKWNLHSEHYSKRPIQEVSETPSPVKTLLTLGPRLRWAWEILSMGIREGPATGAKRAGAIRGVDSWRG